MFRALQFVEYYVDVENNATARRRRDDWTSKRVCQEPQLRVPTRNEGTMSSRGNNGKEGSCT
jgi:hypothetical protein